MSNDTQEALIAFDVGNTSLKAAVGRDGRWEAILRISVRPLDTLGARLAEALDERSDAVPKGARRWVAASVCAEADAVLAEDCRARGVPGPQMFGRDLPVPIPALVRRPERVGVDRLLCALGARATAGAPCIVVGAGTAITVDLVDEEGRFAGGAIAPGFALAARALHEGTSALPQVESARPEVPVGVDTEEAIRSGVWAFCRGGVHELICRFAEGRDAAPMVVLTGGDAELLEPLDTDLEVRREPELIFLGMEAALRESG